jgi:hypothetical protein
MHQPLPLRITELLCGTPPIQALASTPAKRVRAHLRTGATGLGSDARRRAGDGRTEIRFWSEFADLRTRMRFANSLGSSYWLLQWR